MGGRGYPPEFRQGLLDLLAAGYWGDDRNSGYVAHLGDVARAATVRRALQRVEGKLNLVEGSGV
jgi:hypothetical protein